jgi:hypothetical protein
VIGAEEKERGGEFHNYPSELTIHVQCGRRPEAVEERGGPDIFDLAVRDIKSAMRGVHHGKYDAKRREESVYAQSD